MCQHAHRKHSLPTQVQQQRLQLQSSRQSHPHISEDSKKVKCVFSLADLKKKGSAKLNNAYLCFKWDIMQR